MHAQINKMLIMLKICGKGMSPHRCQHFVVSTSILCFYCSHLPHAKINSKAIKTSCMKQKNFVNTQKVLNDSLSVLMTFQTLTEKDFGIDIDIYNLATSLHLHIFPNEFIVNGRFRGRYLKVSLSFIKFVSEINPNQCKLHLNFK